MGPGTFTSLYSHGDLLSPEPFHFAELELVPIKHHCAAPSSAPENRCSLSTNLMTHVIVLILRALRAPLSLCEGCLPLWGWIITCCSMLSFAFCCCVEHNDQKQHGEELTVHHWGKPRQAKRQKSGKNIAHWLAPRLTLSHLSYIT